MEIKTFEAYSLNDAIKMVKKELGKDAVILSTREKEQMSKNSKTPQKIFEVSATSAVGRVLQESELDNIKKPEFKRISRGDEAIVVKSSPNMRQLNPETQKLAKAFANTLKPNEAKKEPHSSDNQAMEKIDELKQELNRIRRDIENLPQFDVAGQMQEIKFLLHDLAADKYRKTIEEGSKSISDTLIRLRSIGVSEVVLQDLATHLISLKGEEEKRSEEKRSEFILNETIRYLFREFKTTGAFKSQENRPRIMCFVGPTGAGKTSTIAKLGAQLLHMNKSEVFFVSMDNFKVAAAEQLRIFSKILNCQFAQPTDLKELEKIIQRQNKTGFILLDTTGFNVRSQEQNHFLRELKQLPIPIEFHLVLPASLKQRDLLEITYHFRPLQPVSLIFTKLDESWCYGEILNTAIQSKIPLSYFSTGHRIPEDLEVATKERVIERLLNF